MQFFKRLHCIAVQRMGLSEAGMNVGESLEAKAIVRAQQMSGILMFYSAKVGDRSHL